MGRELEQFLVEHCSVARRRFKQTQCWYVFLGLLEGAPPMLTRVPPRSGGTWAAWSARQPTARDDGAGVYTPGMRVDVQRLLELDFLPAGLRLALVEGHRYRWSQWPARSRKPNYRSCCCEDNIEHAAPEFDRLIDMGLVEGPLDYVPWVVNPIACIVKWERFKVRNVMDSLRSGVNECMVRVMCELYMVDSVYWIGWWGAAGPRRPSPRDEASSPIVPSRVVNHPRVWRVWNTEMVGRG